ncbi:DUF4983 domain-containing protein [Mucilaginibacter sp. UR6-1]|uniref:alkaline phosphatase family protein n=1 Tax=Mucilaginibacter sp. UR6-1 TaxID=1435643 RepID=UPI001E5FFAF9|nr:alkaline phosphatase family protein [Mucilaginibacter sp. UR6-1]MCC8408089.1 DUF4983 domain-containing protein [Mucilaginibacter sp. UR6-1]
MRKLKTTKAVALLFICALLTAAIVSCNKDFARVLPDKEYNDSVNVLYGKRKVLYLIVDGARGASISAANVPNIKALLPTSIYSWVGLNDPESKSDVRNWADMLTGVKSNKHGVVSNDLEGNNLERYKLIFQNIKEVDPTIKVASFSASNTFKTSLTTGADVSEAYSTDAEVKAALVNNIDTDTASLIIGHFNDIDEAGAQYGYDNSFPQYKAAIETFDSYVGEIINAVKGRENYTNEDWMIVIASSGGGEFAIPSNQNDNTVFSNTSANTFTIYSALKYKTRIITKPFTGNRYLGRTVRMQGEAVRAEIDTADVFNLGGDTSKFTIELKVKKNGEKFNWPSILGKRREWSSGHPSVGWVIYLEEKYWYFELRGVNDINGNYRQCRGRDLEPGQWKNLTVKCELRGGRRYIRTYTNGQFDNEIDITDAGSLDNNDKLKLGYMNGTGHGSPDVYLSDIRFFKTTLPDAAIAEYACQTTIDEGHPYYTFLAGYWPGTDGQGNLIRDFGPQARDFELIGDYKWEDFNDLICPPNAATLAQYVPQTTDIPSQILNWFRIASRQSWDLDGRVWIDQ